MRAIVTGATSGIGREVARSLAQHGAAVGIVGRNPAKTAATLDELRASAPGAEIDFYIADLSELAEVRTLAKELHERNDRIDVLVNNAGVNNSMPIVNSDGIDVMLTTNYLAPFLLTNLVLDLLRAASPSRVVNVASEAHRMADRIDVDHLTEFFPAGVVEGNRLYGRTKLELILFTQELARRVEGDGVTVNAVCPGLVATGLVGDNPTVTRAAALLSRTPLIRRPQQGARMPVRLATDPALGGVTGRFFSSTPGAGILPTARPRRDQHLQRNLWERTAELVGLGS